MAKEPEKKTSSINVRMEPVLKDLLNRLALQKGSNPSQLAREGLILLLTQAGLLDEGVWFE